MKFQKFVSVSILPPLGVKFVGLGPAVRTESVLHTKSALSVSARPDWMAGFRSQSSFESKVFESELRIETGQIAPFGVAFRSGRVLRPAQAFMEFSRCTTGARND